MEEIRDLQVNVGRQSGLRGSGNGNIKSTLSGRSPTPKGSPSFRRLNSSRTPRRDGRSGGGNFQWIRSNRLLLWLILITLWAYLGFYVQSKWAHGDEGGKAGFVGYRSKDSRVADGPMSGDGSQKFLVVKNGSSDVNVTGKGKKGLNFGNVNVSLVKKSGRGSARRSMSVRKSKERRSRGRTRGKEKVAVGGPNGSLEVQEEDIPKRNTSYGLLVGPFGTTEDRVLGWTAAKRSGTCDRKSEFARLVWSRKFVLVFHELSMTGAPLSMLELATELMSCGATVSVVIINKRGGLMGEITRRKIKIVEDKAQLSFKTAMKADLVIAGSAVCASWIEQYLAHFAAGSNQIAWWIMENRREYFDRAKPLLSRVKMLIFLSESQSKQWLNWSEQEGIKLDSPGLVPLSVNDELAFVAGLPCSLNTPSFTVEKMLERRLSLRNAVREEMGLTDNDMLVMSLSSINPGKGQLLLLEAAHLAAKGDLALEGSKIKIKEENTTGVQKNQSTLSKNKQPSESVKSSGILNNPKKKASKLSRLLSHRNHSKSMTILSHRNHSKSSTSNMRKLLSDNGEAQNHTFRVLIGSVGSKSNKVPYVKGLLRFLSEHPELSKVVLWSPATTHVASLYSAADVYIINSQGVGETFGRVTVEAMAFGLPVLGTDAGGTQEIVEHNITGLLHPVGRPGTEALAKNLLFLLHNPAQREQMGIKGRRKVEKMYLKQHTYKQFAWALIKCLRIK